MDGRHDYTTVSLCWEFSIGSVDWTQQADLPPDDPNPTPVDFSLGFVDICNSLSWEDQFELFDELLIDFSEQRRILGKDAETPNESLGNIPILHRRQSFSSRNTPRKRVLNIPGSFILPLNRRSIRTAQAWITVHSPFLDNALQPLWNPPLR